VNDSKKRDVETAGFKNVKFVQGDALNPDTFRDELKDCDGVIHTVGSMFEGVSYSHFFEKAKDWLTTGKYNPMEALFRYRKESKESNKQ
jgi:nucleoside-diphosphate-sugar epimerase